MRKLIVFTWLCSIALLGSCVNLDKPASVAECEKNGTCPAGADGGGDFPVAQDGIANQPDTPLDEASVDAPRGTAETADDGADDGLEAGPEAPNMSTSTGTATGTFTDNSTSTATVTDTTTATGQPGPDAAIDAPQGSDEDAREDDAPILSETCAIDGVAAPAGTTCRASNGPCDVVEFCDGVSTACPVDRFKPASEVCRPQAGNCDIEEKCTGTSAACPADKVFAKGAVCRAAASIYCDVAESCDGVHPTCPVDSFAPAGTTCRPSTNGCDPPEVCTGASNSCPADVKYTAPTAVPTGVTVTPGTLMADVSWSPVAAATGYNVKSSTLPNAGFAVRGSPTAPPFTVTGLNAGQTYYFVVSAYSGQPTCESADSASASAVSCVATAPTGLSATPDKAGKVALTWQAPSGSVASYNVSRSTTSGSGYVVVASGLATTSYTDNTNLATGKSQTFYYAVRANTGSCNSPYSTQATAIACNACSSSSDAATNTD